MELVLLMNQSVRTTSLLVASAFDRRHDNVLRAYDELEMTEDFRLLNFEESKYLNKQKRETRLIYMTRAGFMLLASSFSGTKATLFRQAIIAAFDKMELALRAKINEPTLLPTYLRRIKAQPAKKCPRTKWNIFNMINQLMIEIENEVGSVNEYDLVDGSVGQHWSKYRSDKPWRKQVTQFWYKFNDKRGEQLANCYDYFEAPYFNVWLEEIYMKEHLPNYLKAKFKKDEVMYPRVLKYLPKILPGKSA